jgi:hypothetical protein
VCQPVKAIDLQVGFFSGDVKITVSLNIELLIENRVLAIRRGLKEA